MPAVTFDTLRLVDPRGGGVYETDPLEESQPAKDHATREDVYRGLRGEMGRAEVIVALALTQR
jgi:hypothetical protein